MQAQGPVQAGNVSPSGGDPPTEVHFNEDVRKSRIGAPVCHQLFLLRSHPFCPWGSPSTSGKQQWLSPKPDCGPSHCCELRQLLLLSESQLVLPVTCSSAPERGLRETGGPCGLEVQHARPGSPSSPYPLPVTSPVSVEQVGLAWVLGTRGQHRPS